MKIKRIYIPLVIEVLNGRDLKAAGVDVGVSSERVRVICARVMIEADRLGVPIGYKGVRAARKYSNLWMDKLRAYEAAF
tara:strand:- start:463 stop:699 length:237 start_codon:yes stop_codon:yes gene_type:complete